ncbi:DegT/DnrJ/EryC1/StrS family aminotransferase [Pedobacter sp. FW305-3-2-15-E-R2A2]|uniref:DegT/DnrJ/EryC1/StrS family aminotransferase n=1 Tax=Pedobacter sp. FW305-3-2-15-E-R2A2 TaxID=3140251 RepID=UPI003140720F
MIPRGKLDIPFSDIFAGIGYCISGYFFSKHAQRSTITGTNQLMTLSVRTGLDLTLSALNFPPGTEILVSDINIPDMFNILAAHQLRAIPLPVNKYTLGIDAEQVAAAISPATKAILIAHLFGGISPLNEIAEIAKKNQLILIEDCAQAFQGEGYHGHPDSAVLMFSFGMIKTNTAISGAILQLNDPELYAKVDALNEQLPKQRINPYLKKLFKAMFISLLGNRRWYTLFYNTMMARGKDFDQVLSSFTRGFPGNDPLKKIRYRPSEPNKRLLERRLNAFKVAHVHLRKKLFREVMTGLPADVQIGYLNQKNTNWVIPIQCQHPEEMIRHLRANGYDASSKASSLVRLSNLTAAAAAAEKTDALSLTQLVYLPMDTSMSLPERMQLSALIKEKLP